jgi:hypothetical protein
MPTKKPAPLPESLRHLQPFANVLAKLPLEDLNEDVDPTRLEAVLRKRIRDLDLEAAEAQLATDRELLEGWLEDKPDHPAHWILGFILSPTLATDLTQPSEPAPRGPEMLFEAPKGWKVKAVPSALDLRGGKVVGSVMAIDEASFEFSQREREQTAKLRWPGQQTANEISDVAFNGCSGKKYVFRMIKPAPWKQVDYLLRVPGGCVWIKLSTMTGADFDESTLESKLHTLRLSASACRRGAQSQSRTRRSSRKPSR